jgi:succinate dehydrogenase/fumarate reductase flavoprotein subunit
VALDVETGEPVTIAARAVVLAGGGLTKLYRRNSSSVNMGGDAYALALRAGAELIDMEIPHFFPIGHLAPRLICMDPIMWDAFRYKLGGLLLNGDGEEFIENYGETDSGIYTAMRDITAYAITKEVEAGRGSPSGGAYLSFQHVPEADLRAEFGPIIDRLAANGIDLAERPVEVAPIAHYHMGGIRVDERMETRVAGLFAAGEAVGGANGANRLSGNAITEAFVFGERAGRFAAERAGSGPFAWRDSDAESLIGGIRAVRARTLPRGDDSARTGELWGELQGLMWERVGVLRTEAGMTRALDRIREMRTEVHDTVGHHGDGRFDMEMQDVFDLRASLLTAEAVTLAALRRRESRGAHQREDLPAADPALEKNQIVRLDDGGDTETDWADVVRADIGLAPVEASASPGAVK